ncbi:MAG TPA: extracellular solute-binding protein [Spirochaetales bacterium]|nr:extracellular solute-binding protein [Spirochaetales bacterium]
MLAFHPGGHFHSYAARGYLQPVEALLPGRKFEKSFPAQLRQAASHDSFVMFVPLSWTWWGIFYNKKVLADTGAKLPASLDDLFALAPLLRKGGFIPFTASAKDNRALSAWLRLFLSVNPDTSLYQSFCSGSVPFNDVKVATALQQFAILIKNKYIIDSAIMLSREQALGPLLSGRAAMFLSDAGILKNIPKDDRENIGIAVFPSRNGQGLVYADMEGFVVHAKAQNKANARKFLAYIVAPENQEAMSLPFSRLPANLSGKQSSSELEATKALLSGTRTVVVSMNQNMPAAAVSAAIAELVNIFSLPSNLPLYLQNLEAKRVELFKVKN